MNSPTTAAPTVPRSAIGRALAVIALVGLGWTHAAAQAAVEVNINQDRFQTNGVVGEIGGGLRLGTFQGSDWWAFTTPDRARTFQLTGPESGNGAYTFLTASSAFKLDSIAVSFNGGNDTVDGWFEFWNGNTLVASGNSHLDRDVRDQLEKRQLAFHLGVNPGGPSITNVTLAGWGDVGYYTRVTFVYDTAGKPANYAGITSFTVQSQDPNGQLGLAPVSAPVPEPGTYAMMLAGLGAIGFMTRRRRPLQD